MSNLGGKMCWLERAVQWVIIDIIVRNIAIGSDKCFSIYFLRYNIFTIVECKYFISTDTQKNSFTIIEYIILKQVHRYHFKSIIFIAALIFLLPILEFYSKLNAIEICVLQWKCILYQWNQVIINIVPLIPTSYYIS